MCWRSVANFDLPQGGGEAWDCHLLARAAQVGTAITARRFLAGDPKSSTDQRNRSCIMTFKSKTLAGAGLAAFAGLALVSAVPAFAQMQGQNAPPSQSYQNSPTSPMNAPTYNQQTGPGQSGGAMNTSASTESLTSVQNAKTTLASAQVQDSNGQQVGQVSTVHTSTGGKPTKIDITLNSNNGSPAKTIAVNASELRYNPNSNTLITNLSATDLQSMPAATSTGM
jgi:hypothetical protein